MSWFWWQAAFHLISVETSNWKMKWSARIWWVVEDRAQHERIWSHRLIVRIGFVGARETDDMQHFRNLGGRDNEWEETPQDGHDGRKNNRRKRLLSLERQRLKMGDNDLSLRWWMMIFEMMGVIDLAGSSFISANQSHLSVDVALDESTIRKSCATD